MVSLIWLSQTFTMPQNFPTCTFLGNLRVSLFGIKTAISAKDKEKRKNIMLQLKVDTRFIDKKFILGIKLYSCSKRLIFSSSWLFWPPLRLHYVCKLLFLPIYDYFLNPTNGIVKICCLMFPAIWVDQQFRIQYSSFFLL